MIPEHKMAVWYVGFTVGGMAFLAPGFRYSVGWAKLVGAVAIALGLAPLAWTLIIIEWPKVAKKFNPPSKRRWWQFWWWFWE